MWSQDDVLCLQYFGNQESTFQANVDDTIYNLSNPFNQKKTTIEVSNNNNFLTNYETLALLIIKKKEISSSSDEYLTLFKSNINQFINVSELVLKKYFNCKNYEEWQQNIVKLLNHHHENSHTNRQLINATDSIIISKFSSLTSTTNIENVKQLYFNYGILNDYIRFGITDWEKKRENENKPLYWWTCPTTVTTVLEYFLRNYERKQLVELSDTTATTTTIEEENKLLMKRIEELEYSNTQQEYTIFDLQQQSNLQQTKSIRMENNQLKEQINKLQLQLSDSKQQQDQNLQQQSNLKDFNYQLKEQIIKLHLQLSQSNQQQQLNLKHVNQLKEQINKLELQLSQANTALSLNSFNLLQQKYIEQSKNILLKYFNNELLDILLNLPLLTTTIDDSTHELLEILMKRSICYAFATKYSINTPPTQLLPSSSESSIISSAIQHLVILMTQNGLFSGENGSGLTSIVGILLEKFHKLVKELFDCINSIPSEANIQFDFTNNIKDKTTLIEKKIESTSTSSNSSNSNTITTIGSNNSNGGVVVDSNENYYCIQPTLYSGGCSIVEQQGILVSMFN